MPTVAETIVDALADLGVRPIWGVVGDALNPVTDAIRREDRLEWIGVRHEEAGAFAAGAQAQLTGTLGVCMGTVGPGSTPPPQRPLRRQEVPRAGARHLRPGAAGRARQRLLPGGRQRRGVPRRRCLLPHADQPGAAARAARAGGAARTRRARGGGAHAAGRRRRPRRARRAAALRHRAPPGACPTRGALRDAAARIDAAGTVTLLVGHRRPARARPRCSSWPTGWPRRWC